ncbi:MAG: hypothetical protein AMK73_01175 [Planctomycetes bacterium SM23_32]|nr:MAG: hypothetical protein AMK73_01175 [Planctomycetes bacterium SM23_32]
MTPRELVLAALRGGHGPRVPFTVYECMIPQCADERAMRNRGLCIVQRWPEVYTTHRPNVNVTQSIRWEGGKRLVHTVYETPVGSVSTLEEPAGFTVWRHEKMFRSPDDYRVLEFLIRDEVYAPNYEEFARAEAWRGEDFIMRAGISAEPLQALVSGVMMSMEDFCVQWMENRDEVLRLYEALVEKRRQVYPLVARSPATHANYGGNVVPEIIGPDVFRDYYVPHYDEAAGVLHEHGKLIGCHFDANNRLIADAIAATDLDYVEAFTPAPDTDMSLGEARAAWPDKVLWLNFPSSVHVRPDEGVEQFTVDMLDQVDSVDGLLVGITEDMPPGRWRGSCRAIMDGLERHARRRPDLYA